MAKKNTKKATATPKKEQNKPAFKFTRNDFIQLADRIKAESTEKGTVQ